MIKKENRVPKQLIAHILKKGDTVFTDLFIIKVKRTDNSLPRFRTIVSTKIYKKAVDRNKLRRQIYETLREINTPYTDDYIIIPKKKIITKNYLDISKDLWKTFKNSSKT